MTIDQIKEIDEQIKREVASIEAIDLRTVALRDAVAAAKEEKEAVTSKIATLHQERNNLIRSLGPDAPAYFRKSPKGRKMGEVSTNIMNAMSRDVPMTSAEIAVRCGVDARRVRASLYYLVNKGYVVKDHGHNPKWWLP